MTVLDATTAAADPPGWAEDEARLRAMGKSWAAITKVRQQLIDNPGHCIIWPDTPHAVPQQTEAPNLPTSLWTERPELGHIRQGAHARCRSADAVFGAVLAQCAALTPPWLRWPDPVGSAATGDLLVALIGRSGTGKSSSADAAADLLPIPVDDDTIAVVPLGSGEGVIEAYMGWVDEEAEDGKKRKVRRQVRRAVLAMLDEGQALAEIGGRSGSTLMPTLRSAWSGNRLGQANAAEDRRRHLAPGEYRFALIAGFQTEHATALLDDAAGGTPQRFLFLPAEDPNIPDEAPAWPGPLTWKPQATHPRTMGLDVDVAGEIRGRALARSRGLVTIDPLDAHRDLLRLKVAGLLAILAGRLDIDADDWRLAGMVLDASDRVRASIVEDARRRAALAEHGAVRKLISRGDAIDGHKHDQALEGMAKAIARHVHRRGCSGGCKRRCATQSTKSAHRQLATIDEAVDLAVSRRWLVVSNGGYTPGPEAP